MILKVLNELSDIGFNIKLACIRNIERGHILNLVQNASRTLACTCGFLGFLEEWLLDTHGRIIVYSTHANIL